MPRNTSAKRSAGETAESPEKKKDKPNDSTILEKNDSPQQDKSKDSIEQVSSHVNIHSPSEINANERPNDATILEKNDSSPQEKSEDSVEQGPSNADIHHPTKINATEKDRFAGIYEKFTNFDHLVLDSPMNIGIFGVLFCKHVEVADNINLTEPVTNVVFVDSQKKKSVFTIFGEDAESWGRLKTGQVANVENFNWRKDYRHQGRFYGVTAEFRGELNSSSSFKLSANLSKLFQDYRQHQIDHVSFLAEIHDQSDRMVLVLEQKNSKSVIKKEAGPLTLQKCIFITADGMPVTITGFEKMCEKMDHLDEHKVYVIENLKKRDREGIKTTALEFNLTANTVFTLATVQPGVIKAIKISLTDLENATETDIYETEVFIRQTSVKPKGVDYKQTLVFQLEEDKNSCIAAVIRFTDSIELVAGQKINMKFHVKVIARKNYLYIVRGSVTTLPEHFPVDDIGALHFNVV